MQNELLYIIIITLFLYSCSNEETAEETYDKLENQLDKSQTKIDSLTDAILNELEEKSGSFERFQRDSNVKYEEVVLEYEE